MYITQIYLYAGAPHKILIHSFAMLLIDRVQTLHFLDVLSAQVLFIAREYRQTIISDDDLMLKSFLLNLKFEHRNLFKIKWPQEMKMAELQFRF